MGEGQQPPYYCLLNCEDAEKWQGHEKLSHDLLHLGAKWDHFKCWAGELPPLDSLGRYSGVFLTGGHYSAYEDRPWINQLAEWLGEAARAHPGVRFLGVCFGCQILARALGGQVGRNPSGRFVLRVEEVRLLPELRSDPAFRRALEDLAADRNAAGDAPSAASAQAAAAAAAGGAGSTAAEVAAGGPVAEGGPGGGKQAEPPPPAPVPDMVRLIQSHGDQVLALPHGAVLLAESPTAPHEVWGWGGNVLAVQGHPELTSALVMEKIYPAVAGAGRLTPAEQEAAAQSITATPTDAQLVTHFLKRFMERGLACCPARPPPAHPQLGEAAVEPAGAAAGAGAAPSEEGPLRLNGSNAAAAAAAAAAEARAGEGAGEQAPASGTQREAGRPSNQDAGGTAGSRPAMPGGAVASSGYTGGGGSSSSGVEDAERALHALGLGVSAELGRVPEEYHLLQECNAVAEGRYRHMGRVVVQANRVLQGVREQQGALDPALRAIEALEAQVCQLEGVMAHMQATAARLQHALNHGGSGQ